MVAKFKDIPEAPVIQPSSSAFTTVEVSTSPLPVLQIRQSLPVHEKIVFYSSISTGNKSKLQILKPHQSITSMTFGFPSEVTRNPAAAGSTPESETLNLIRNNSIHTNMNSQNNS